MGVKIKQDAAKFIEILLGGCTELDTGHNWHRCKRCLAISQIENRDPLAMKFLTVAANELEKK